MVSAILAYYQHTHARVKNVPVIAISACPQFGTSNETTSLHGPRGGLHGLLLFTCHYQLGLSHRLDTAALFDPKFCFDCRKSKVDALLGMARQPMGPSERCATRRGQFACLLSVQGGEGRTSRPRSRSKMVASASCCIGAAAVASAGFIGGSKSSRLRRKLACSSSRRLDDLNERGAPSLCA